MMREDIKGPRKLAAKADMIWQSASDRSVNVVPAASPPGQVPEEAALNTLSKSSSPSYFPCCSLSWSTYCPSSCSILLSELRPLLVPPQPPRPSSTLPPPLLIDSSLLSRLFNSPSHCWGGGAPHPCFGACANPLQFGSQHFSWFFQLAPVSVPILGSDFL